METLDIEACPGSGKTTALEHLAYEFALENLHTTVDNQTQLIPLPLRLSEFGPGLTVEDFIAQGWAGAIETGHWGAPELFANLEGYLEAA